MKTTSRKTNSGREAAQAREHGGRDVAHRPHRARKRFGQHFLEAAWVDKLIAAIEPAASDVFLEVGPGRGALTLAIAPRVARVIAVEIDRDLAAALPSRVPPNVEIVEGDFLRTDLNTLLGDVAQPVRVVGNLPYNVASPILFQLLHGALHGRLLRDATLMLQKEVADRLCAEPGTRSYGAMAIQVSLLADVDRLLTLPPGAFRPAPKVTSAVVRLRFREPLAAVSDLQGFERLVRGLFLQRRKTLLNAFRPHAEAHGLDAAQVIELAGLDPGLRPEALTVQDMARLARAVL
ncbi:MAG: ribosomal RNA small subunit methyltransferase A [Acidobacteria bacterium]|nr:ribosomal RNA small subunit methyltransferase A [Acidobacteriota bacterium]